MTELVLESFGIFNEPFSTKAMDWGNEQEPFARAKHEITQDILVEQCGYILHHLLIHLDLHLILK